MRRAPILTTAILAAAGVVLFASAAAAQNAGVPAGEARGLRYLSWSGRGESVPPATPDVAAPVAVRRDLRRPNPVIPHGGHASLASTPVPPGSPPPVPARRTLTPANAWMHPAASRPEPAIVPAPVSAPPATVPVPPLRAAPDYLPDPGGRGQAVPANLIQAPTSARADPVDPMAPRRDAPIFRMQQDTPPPIRAVAPIAAVAQPDTAPAETLPPRRIAETAGPGEPQLQQGGRYYSVHRQNGRQPDALEMPDPSYVDGLAITMPETLASQDLAAPEQGPTLIRDAQGRIRPAPAASDGDYQ